MAEPKRTINLAYKPALAPTAYVVTSTVNTLRYKPGDALQEVAVLALIKEGFTVKVTS